MDMDDIGDIAAFDQMTQHRHHRVVLLPAVMNRIFDGSGSGR